MGRTSFFILAGAQIVTSTNLLGNLVKKLERLIWGPCPFRLRNCVFLHWGRHTLDRGRRRRRNVKKQASTGDAQICSVRQSTKCHRLIKLPLFQGRVCVDWLWVRTVMSRRENTLIALGSVPKCRKIEFYIANAPPCACVVLTLKLCGVLFFHLFFTCYVSTLCQFSS